LFGNTQAHAAATSSRQLGLFHCPSLPQVLSLLRGRGIGLFARTEAVVSEEQISLAQPLCVREVGLQSVSGDLPDQAFR
jgi:hypothetical protein